MDETQTNLPDTQGEKAPDAALPARETEPEGIEHDPYEWGKCAITAHIVWLPDGAVMLGVRNHLDAPIIRLLSGDELVSLSGHAAELPIPAVDGIANLLAQLREDLPLRAQAANKRAEEAMRRKIEAVKGRRESSKKAAPTQPASAQMPASIPAKLPPAGQTPAATQVTLFNFMTGGNQP
jgi:hypothetical protein